MSLFIMMSWVMEYNNAPKDMLTMIIATKSSAHKDLFFFLKRSQQWLKRVGHALYWGFFHSVFLGISSPGLIYSQESSAHKDNLHKK